MKLSSAKAILRSLINAENAPSVMLWGPPGIGKSDLIKQIGKELGWPVIDWRLATRNPVDLRGIPVPDKTTMRAVWYPPSELPYEDRDGKQGILFLDEVANAPRDVQTAALQLVLDRKLDEYKVPDNWVVVAAGNRVIDRAGSYQMASSLCNRFLHLPICCKIPDLAMGKDCSVDVDLDDWKKWAFDNNIREEVISFLSYQPIKLWEASGQVAYPSPRSWEFVSHVLDIVGFNENTNAAVAGCIGDGATATFMAFCRVRNEMPNVEDIFDGMDVACPKKPDILYSLCGAIISKLKRTEDNQKLLRYMDNLLAWYYHMPTEFQVLLTKDIGKIGLMTQFSMRPEFIKWAAEHKDIFDAII